MFENLAGQTFGLLRVMRLHRITDSGHAIWVVECPACNTRKPVRAAHLKSGRTKSCIVCKRKAKATR